MQPVARLIPNILSSWAGFALRIVIALIFVPFITGILGGARYGVWVLVFQLVNYFFLFDFGMEKALARFIPGYLGKMKWDAINKLLVSSTALYGLAGLFSLAGAAIVAYAVLPRFAIGDAALVSEGQWALLLVGLYTAIRFLFFPLGGSLGSFHRFDLAKGLEMVEEVGRTVVFIGLLVSGYGLVSLALTMVLFTLAKNVAGFVLLKRLHPEVRPSLAHLDRASMRRVLGYSKTAFAITVAWIFLFNSDSLLLGALASVGAVGVYAPGAQVMLYLRHLINAVGMPLTPAVAHIEATSDAQSVRDIYLKALSYVSYLAFFLCIGVLAYANDFVSLWLEPEFENTAIVMMILAGSAAFFLPQLIGNAVLFAIEKHRYLLYILIIELIAKLTLAVVSIEIIKAIEVSQEIENVQLAFLIAMACSSAIPQFLLYLFVYPVFMKRATGVRARTIVNTSLMSGMLAAVIAAPSARIANAIWTSDTWGGLAFNVIAVTIATGIGAFAFVLEPEDRQRLLAFIPGRSR